MLRLLKYEVEYELSTSKWSNSDSRSSGFYYRFDLKGISGQKKLHPNEIKYATKGAITDHNAPNGSRDTLIQSQEFEQDVHRHCRFSASFSLKYDVAGAMLQDNEKIKVQYLRNLLFDLFETLQAVRNWQRNFASFQILLPWQPKSKLLSFIEKQRSVV